MTLQEITDISMSIIAHSAFLALVCYWLAKTLGK